MGLVENIIGVALLASPILLFGSNHTEKQSAIGVYLLIVFGYIGYRIL